MFEKIKEKIRENEQKKLEQREKEEKEKQEALQKERERLLSLTEKELLIEILYAIKESKKEIVDMLDDIKWAELIISSEND